MSVAGSKMVRRGKWAASACCLNRVKRPLFTQLPSNPDAGNPLAYAPALLLQDFAYSYRVWITLIKLLSGPLRYPKTDPDIHQGERLCARLLPSILRISEKNSSQKFAEQTLLLCSPV